MRNKILTFLKHGYLFILGHLRYKLYYSRFKWLIRKHILEQIGYRVGVMNQTCLQQGSCIICGCETIALQMVAPSCEGLCYPPFANRRMWKDKKVIVDSGITWIWREIAGERGKRVGVYAPFEETHYGYIKKTQVNARV